MSRVEKMSLPGEAPWGEVIAEFHDGTAKLRIANDLIGGLHGFKRGDELLCAQEDGRWRPVTGDVRVH